MSDDDLVERLRKNVMCGDAVIEEAADRIEQDAQHIHEMYELVAAMNADHAASKTRIEKLEAELHHCFHRIEELQAALRGVIAIADRDCPEFRSARKALEGKDD
jgi:phage shock protein A